MKAHVGRLFTKLDVDNRVQIAICVHDARRAEPLRPRRSRPGPPARRPRSYVERASASTCCAVVPRRDVGEQQPAAPPRPWPTCPASAPVRWMSGGLSAVSRNDASHRNTSAPAACSVRAGHDRGVTRVDQRPAVGPHPQRVGGDRVVDPRRPRPEGTDPDLLPGVGAEVELLAHARVQRQLVGRGEPVGGAGGAPDRDPRLRAERVVLAHHVVAAQVQAVVGVQVAEQHRVDRSGSA